MVYILGSLDFLISRVPSTIKRKNSYKTQTCPRAGHGHNVDLFIAGDLSRDKAYEAEVLEGEQALLVCLSLCFHPILVLRWGFLSILGESTSEEYNPFELPTWVFFHCCIAV